MSAAVQTFEDRRDARLRGMVERSTPAERQALAAILRETTDLGGRTPPHDLDAERAVLAAVLTSGEVLDAIVAILPTGAPFYADAHRRIYDAAVEVRASGQPIDIQTVSTWLKDRERLQTIGDGTVNGLSYLVKLVDATPSVAHVAAHAKIVAAKARLRQLIDTCQLVAGEAYTPLAADTQAFAQLAAERVSQIAEVGVQTRVQSIAEIGRARAEELRAQWRGEREPWGMRGPHPRLHAVTHGYGIGEQTYVAADTGGGKSVFALQVARYLAGRKHAGETIGCGYISLEMRSAKHYDRALLQAAYEIATELRLAPITYRELQTGKDEYDQPLEGARIAVIEQAQRTIDALPIAFDDAGKDLGGIRATARLLQRRMRERGARLRFLVIDHLHLVRLPAARREDEAFARVVAEFNEIAMDLELHLMPLCQFNRGSQDRDVPVRSDIRGAAAIEQIAHKIILLHRPWTRMTRAQKKDAPEEASREAEAIVAKNRDNPEGAVPMDFVGAAFRFDECDDD